MILFYRPADHRSLHSFPTRRSSDLWTQAATHARHADRGKVATLLVRHWRRASAKRKVDPFSTPDRTDPRELPSRRCAWVRFEIGRASCRERGWSAAGGGTLDRRNSA